MKLPALLLSLALTVTAAADLVLDQEHAVISSEYAPITIGGERRDRVAQVFTAGVLGMLEQIELPVGCDGGALVVEIVNTDRWGYHPGTTVRARITIDAKSLPMPPAWQTFTFAPGVPVRPGDTLAVVLRNETGTCGVLRGGPHDPYAGGSAWWSPGHLPPDNWASVCEITPGVTCDLPFRTFVNTPPDRARFCNVIGFGALPFPDSLPVCRCLEDQGIREQRCALLHPAFAIIRRIPQIVRPGEPFTIQWTVWPITPVDQLSVLDAFPSGFDGPDTPLKFVSPGQPVTLEYKAVAPKKPGAFKVESTLSLTGDEGVMQSVIEVQP